MWLAETSQSVVCAIPTKGLFVAGRDQSAAQPFLLQLVNNQLVHDFLSQQNNILFRFLSEIKDLFVAGRDQSAADQPNNLAKGHPPL